MNKELIKKRFSRKLNSYNENARIQKQMAEKLLDLLNPSSSNTGGIKILEIGCGTGLLTKLVSDKFNYEKYTAIDIVPECEDFVRGITPDIEFISSDIEEYIKTINTKYDLILSNAALQWMENLPELVEMLVNKLNPNGKLVFSTFGKENFREIYYVLGKTLNYYSKNEIEEVFEKYNPIIEEEVRIMAFKTPQNVLKHIQNTGVNAISQDNWTKRDLINFEKEYNVFCANHPTLTYNPIYISITK